MNLLFFAPQVLILFSGAFLFAVAGFWLSFVETLTSA
jgi:hypothetical protein